MEEAGDYMPDRWRWSFRLILALVLICVLVWAADSLFPVSLGPRVVLEPWLLASGFQIYTDVVDQHEPALPVLVELLIRAGLTPISAANFLFLLIQFVTLVLLYFASERVKTGSGLLSLLLYGAMAPRIIQGKLWYDMAMAPLLIAAAMTLFHNPLCQKASRFFYAGVFLGGAFLVKQHVIAVVAMVMVWLALEYGIRAAMALCFRTGLGFALLPALHLFWRWKTGSLAAYFHWCWFINDRYLDLASLAPQPHEVIAILPLMLLVFLSIFLWKQPGYRLVLTMGAGAANLAFPRYAPFHLAAAFPFFVISAAGVVIESMKDDGAFTRMLVKFRLSRLVLTSGIVCIALSTAHPWRSAGNRVRILEYDNLAPVSELVRSRLAPGKRMAIFPEDEATSNLYVQSQRLPPGYWLLTYPWYIEDGVQARLIQGLSKVDLVVFFPGRELQGRLPEKYMSLYYQAIQQQFPIEESFQWEQGKGILRLRKAKN